MNDPRALNAWLGRCLGRKLNPTRWLARFESMPKRRLNGGPEFRN